MKLSQSLLKEYQNRLKVGNRRGVHLNAIPGRSRYKFDLFKLAEIREELPKEFVDALLSECPLKFKINWQPDDDDALGLINQDEAELLKIKKSFENLINQTSTIESEKGINTFGFGYPLMIRKDTSDNRLTVAPILIWNLKIKRASRLNTWEISRNVDDPIYVNEILINHLYSDSNVQISQIDKEDFEDGIITKDQLNKICSNFYHRANGLNDTQGITVFDEIWEDLGPIKDKAFYERRIENTSRTLIKNSGLFSIFEVQKQNIIHDYDRLLQLGEVELELEDLDENGFEQLSSVQTDPSQQGILNGLLHKRNLLIQGPPGTGKSQSLTAIIINAMSSGKKVLVVCEKQTALDVLQKALQKRKLSQHSVIIYDAAKDRKRVVNSVRNRTDNHSYVHHDQFKYSEIKNGLLELIDEVNNFHQALGQEIIQQRNWPQLVGDYLKNKGSTSQFNLEDLDLELTEEEYRSLKSLLKRGQELYKDYQPYTPHSFLNHDHILTGSKYQVESEVENVFDSYVAEFQEITNHGDEVKTEYVRFRTDQLEKVLTEIRETIDTVFNGLHKYGKEDNIYDDTYMLSFSSKLKAFFNGDHKVRLSGYKRLKKLLDDAVVKLWTLNFGKFSGKDVLLNKLHFLEEGHANLKKVDEDSEQYFNNEFIDQLNGDGNTSYLKSSRRFKNFKSQLNALAEKVSEDKWVADTYKFNGDSLSIGNKMKGLNELFDRYSFCFRGSEDVFFKEYEWVKFHNSLGATEKQIVNRIKESLHWLNELNGSYFGLLLKKHAADRLPTNDKSIRELNRLLSDFKEVQLNHIRWKWNRAQQSAVNHFNLRKPINVVNLFNKRSSQRHRRMSLREISNYDTDLLTTFFPVILTTPDVASNLFLDKDQYFDFVIFDEASQLRVEDTLPALLKGKQVVIAGDEHQMPPSNFFSKIFEGTLEDEEDLEEEEEEIRQDDFLLGCESLLEFGEQLNFEKRYLDFHYRSNHPYLIDFSNEAFYNGRLVPLPEKMNYVPMKYCNVGGTYSGSTNEREVSKIMEILDREIVPFTSGEYPSVGIATFNITQRDLILGSINERRNLPGEENFDQKMTKLEEVGFFVKNLENIQGDERDIIIISTVYGLNPKGTFHQRFGPINFKKGYKLLNVIITRAKWRLYVCTSFPESYISRYRDFLLAQGENNRRAVMFAYLAYVKAVSHGNDEQREEILHVLKENGNTELSAPVVSGMLESPFEEEVYNVLLKHFDEENIILQYKYGGFRIDMVIDSGDPAKPRIAIECDGASYHSGKEAYVYDIHRQNILESYGFVFHRIWSTNWWRNSQREEQRMIEFIKGIFNDSEGPEQLQNEQDFPMFPESPEVDCDATEMEPVEFVDDEFEEGFLECGGRTENETPIQGELDFETPLPLEPEFDNVPQVEIGDRVIVEFLENNQEMEFEITKTSTNVITITDGVNRLRHKAPLAIAVLGQPVGRIVRIVGQDNFVRILKIQKK